MKTDNKKNTNKKNVRNKKAGGRKTSAAPGGGSGKKSTGKPAASPSPPKKNPGPDRSRSIGRVAATTSTGSKLRLVPGNAAGGKSSRSPKSTGSLGSLQNTGRRKGLIAAGVLFFLLLTAAGVLFYISRHYHVETIYVDGNVHYTNEEITIPLDPAMTPGENSKKYFDRYGKLKRTEEALTEQIADTEAEIEHLESISNALDIARAENDLSQIKEELTEYGYIKKHYSNKKGQKAHRKHII